MNVKTILKKLEFLWDVTLGQNIKQFMIFNYGTDFSNLEDPEYRKELLTNLSNSIKDVSYLNESGLAEFVSKIILLWFFSREQHISPAENKDEELSKFAKLIISLDMSLTGKTYRDAYNTHTHTSISKPSNFFDSTGDRLYYLSDGGYSRLGFSLTKGLFLTSGSLEQVFDRWHQSTDLINELNRMIFDEYNYLLENE